MTLPEIMNALRDGLSVGKSTTSPDYPPHWSFFEYENPMGGVDERLTLHGWGAHWSSTKVYFLEDLLLHPETWVLGSRVSDDHGHLGDFQPYGVNDESTCMEREARRRVGCCP